MTVTQLPPKLPSFYGGYLRFSLCFAGIKNPLGLAASGFHGLPGITLDLLLVPEVGIEPTLGFPNQILSLARLPVSPLRQQAGDYTQSDLRMPLAAFLGAGV